MADGMVRSARVLAHLLKMLQGWRRPTSLTGTILSVPKLPRAGLARRLRRLWKAMASGFRRHVHPYNCHYRPPAWCRSSSSEFLCRQPKIGPAKLDGPMTIGYGNDAIEAASKRWASQYGRGLLISKRGWRMMILRHPCGPHATLRGRLQKRKRWLGARFRGSSDEACLLFQARIRVTRMAFAYPM